MQKENLHIRQMGTRYIDDPDWGYTFLNVE